MNVLDVNVVIPLHRPDHECHEVASSWWQESIEAGDTFTVPDLVWVGFARMITNPRMFPAPSTVDDVWAFVAAMTAQPKHVTWVSHPRTMEEFARLCERFRARANLVTDAYIAACAQTYGGTVVTFDRDFRRFDDLRVTELSA